MAEVLDTSGEAAVGRREATGWRRRRDVIGSWFERRRENPRNAVGGGEIFILQMRMQHPLEALQCRFLTYFVDTTAFADFVAHCRTTLPPFHAVG
jgi:hypothetical protein